MLTVDAKDNLYAISQDYMREGMDVEGALVTVPVPDGAEGGDALRSAAAAAGVSPFIIRKKQQGIPPVRAYRVDEAFSVATGWGARCRGRLVAF